MSSQHISFRSGRAGVPDRTRTLEMLAFFIQRWKPKNAKEKLLTKYVVKPGNYIRAAVRVRVRV